uniref:Uncharacterized protein n=1 Tax=viral metagenome TaxID=1070528 RepID=A0A6M3LII0_9ZZZZ
MTDLDDFHQWANEKGYQLHATLIHRVETVRPAIDQLREEGWTWQRIADWLTERKQIKCSETQLRRACRG